MACYRLKDKELQKKLDEISDGDFTRKLNRDLQYVHSPLDKKIKYRVFFGDPPDFIANRFSADFRCDEVEEIPEYNLGGWNHWPETKPPELELMQIVEDGDDDNHAFLFYLHGIWYYGMGLSCISLSEKKFKYRPARLFFQEQSKQKEL